MLGNLPQVEPNVVVRISCLTGVTLYLFLFIYVYI